MALSSRVRGCKSHLRRDRSTFGFHRAHAQAYRTEHSVNPKPTVVPQIAQIPPAGFPHQPWQGLWVQRAAHASRWRFRVLGPLACVASMPQILVTSVSTSPAKKNSAEETSQKNACILRHHWSGLAMKQKQWTLEGCSHGLKCNWASSRHIRI